MVAENTVPEDEDRDDEAPADTVPEKRGAEDAAAQEPAVPEDRQADSGDQQHRPLVIRDVDSLRVWMRGARVAGHRVGLVPTMGALHAGHLSLVQASRRSCQVTVVTVFVNPTQFGPQEDFAQYPRTWDSDLQQLTREGVDLVFAPDAESLYPPGFSTYVEPPEVAQPWEGACRPGHFRGVATIVLKLFQLIPADVAFFGQKDFQQVRVIQQMVTDLDVGMEIEVCPIVREADGLALSSRNRYLSPEQRQRSLGLVRSLKRAQTCLAQREQQPSAVLVAMQSELERSGVDRVDYIALVDPTDLQPVDCVDEQTVALVAAWVGQTRLIDNCRLGTPLSWSAGGAGPSDAPRTSPDPPASPHRTEP